MTDTETIEVETRYEHGTGYPTINVKHYFYWPDIERRFRGSTDHEFGDDTAFWEWADREFEANSYEAFNHVEDWVREDAWEQATELSGEVFGWTTVMVDEKKFFPEFPPGCQWRFTGEKVPRRALACPVYSSGRSGGWLIVHGLGNPEDWGEEVCAACGPDEVCYGWDDPAHDEVLWVPDRDKFAQWQEFAEHVQAIVDHLDYQFVWQLHVNVYEHQADIGFL